MNPPTVGGKFAAKDVGGGVPDAPGGVKTPPYDAKDKGAVSYTHLTLPTTPYV